MGGAQRSRLRPLFFPSVLLSLDSELFLKALLRSDHLGGELQTAGQGDLRGMASSQVQFQPRVPGEQWAGLVPGVEGVAWGPALQGDKAQGTLGLKSGRWQLLLAIHQLVVLFPQSHGCWDDLCPG